MQPTALMEQTTRPFAFCAAALLLNLAIGGADAQDRGTAGAIPQNVPPAISQKPSIPRLQLSPTQRTKIQQALSSEDTDVSFALKSAKGAQNVAPSVGAKVPGGLTLHPLPRGD